MIFNLLTPNVHISKDGFEIFRVRSIVCVETRGVCLFKKERKKNTQHMYVKFNYSHRAFKRA